MGQHCCLQLTETMDFQCGQYSIPNRVALKYGLLKSFEVLNKNVYTSDAKKKQSWFVSACNEGTNKSGISHGTVQMHRALDTSQYKTAPMNGSQHKRSPHGHSESEICDSTSSDCQINMTIMNMMTVTLKWRMNSLMMRNNQTMSTS